MTHSFRSPHPLQCPFRFERTWIYQYLVSIHKAKVFTNKWLFQWDLRRMEMLLLVPMSLYLNFSHELYDNPVMLGWAHFRAWNASRCSDVRRDKTLSIESRAAANEMVGSTLSQQIDSTMCSTSVFEARGINRPGGARSDRRSPLRAPKKKKKKKRKQ